MFFFCNFFFAIKLDKSFLEHWKYFQILDENEWIDNGKYIFECFMNDEEYTLYGESYFEFMNENTINSFIELFKYIHEKFLINHDEGFLFPVKYIVRLVNNMISRGIGIENSINLGMVEFLVKDCVFNTKKSPLFETSLSDDISFGGKIIENDIVRDWLYILTVLLSENDAARDTFRKLNVLNSIGNLVRELKEDENFKMFYVFFEILTQHYDGTDDADLIIDPKDLDAFYSTVFGSDLNICAIKQMVQHLLRISRINDNKETLLQKRSALVDMLKFNCQPITETICEILSNLSDYPAWENVPYNDQFFVELKKYYGYEQSATVKQSIRSTLTNIFEQIKRKLINYIFYEINTFDLHHIGKQKKNKKRLIFFHS